MEAIPKRKTRKHLSLSTKRSIKGFLFAVPFLLGFIFLFLSPLMLYIKFSFSEIYPENQSMAIKAVGWSNYYHVLFVEEGYIKSVIENLGKMLFIVPSILLYSFFFASILNQKFRGRTLARAIFFLPVVISSGSAIVSQTDNVVTSAFTLLNGKSGDSLNMTKTIADFFGTTLSPALFDVVSRLIDEVYNVVVSSGIQIIIFLAALQTISPSLYEASSIEGATGWENFWKITLPMISPMILVNAVYTTIDQLGGMTNPMIDKLYTLSIKEQQYGISSAMGIMYFAIMFIILGLIIFFVSKLVFYENKI